MFLMQNILVETPGLLILDNCFWKYIYVILYFFSFMKTSANWISSFENIGSFVQFFCSQLLQKFINLNAFYAKYLPLQRL
jgi:hypothetical protein